MDINPGTMRGLFEGFNTAFNKGLKEAESYYAKVAMKVTSTGAAETYAWLNDIPGIREWIGDRVVHGLSGSKYSVENRLFEETVTVKRTMIEDDKYGIYGPLFEKLGADTTRHPDTLIFALLAGGFTTLCYDGQNFFDAEHQVGQPGGDPVSVSNIQAGDGAPWYLLDCSQPIKPLIWQERVPFKLTSLDQDKDDNVFWRDQYVYGVRGRSNSGFGLWQLAFASKAELNAENYEAARVAMASLRSDKGKPLGIKGTHLVVPPTLEGPAKRLLNNGTRVEMVEAGETTVPLAIQNEWAGTAELIVTAHVA